MKLLLVTLIVVAAIALTISETEALPQPDGDLGAEREAPVMEGKVSYSVTVS